MQCYASEYLSTHYNKSSVVLKHGFCPKCLCHGKGKQITLIPSLSKVRRESVVLPLNKKDLWQDIFAEGADPCQAIKFHEISCTRPLEQSRLNHMQLLNVKQPGQPCKNEKVCDIRCPLCFQTIGGCPSVQMSSMPGYTFHEICCSKCPIPGCSEYVPFLPKLVLPEQGRGNAIINVCSKHVELIDCKIPEVPFRPIFLLSGKPVPALNGQNTAVFKPVPKSTPSASMTGVTKDSPHKDIRNWLGKGKGAKKNNTGFKGRHWTRNTSTYDADAPSAPSILPACLIDDTPRPSKRSRFDFAPPQEKTSSLGAPEQDHKDKA